MIWETDENTIWLDPFDAFFSINLIPAPQKSVCEIGVYKGGFLMVLLENLPHLQALAVDPYPNSENIKSIFIHNIKAKKLESRVRLLENYDSLSDQKFDLVHIDGEHSEVAVLSDLQFATHNLSSKGIVVIDDIWHPLFPGIVSATMKVIHQGTLAPFLISRNKMYLCKPSEYNHHYNSARSLLKLTEIPYSSGISEGSDILGSKSTYSQANSINGFNQLVVGNINKFQQSLILGLENPVKLSSAREIFKQITPPIFVKILRKSAAAYRSR